MLACCLQDSAKVLTDRLQAMLSAKDISYIQSYTYICLHDYKCVNQPVLCPAAEFHLGCSVQSEEDICPRRSGCCSTLQGLSQLVVTCKWMSPRVTHANGCHQRSHMLLHAHAVITSTVGLVMSAVDTGPGMHHCCTACAKAMQPC